MKSMYKPNISATGRWASTLAGVALTAVGYKRSNRGLELLGTGLIARGVSGWCPVTATVERNSHAEGEPTKRHLGGRHGVIVEDTVTIDRPIDDVYSYWRNLENLPRFMDHLEEVETIDQSRSHWVARGPLGVKVEWDAQIINDIPPTLLSWKSVGESDVISAGSVRFRAAGNHSTEVRVKLQYDPPAGKLGATVAWLSGEDAQQQIGQDLRKFKELVEADEPSRPDRYRDTAPAYGARDLDSDLSSDFGSMR